MGLSTRPSARAVWMLGGLVLACEGDRNGVDGDGDADADGDTDADGDVDADADGDADAELAAVWGGLWDGDFGPMAIAVEGGTVRGAYDWDDGTLVGSVGDDEVLRAWWCETPSRAPPNDAGQIELRLVGDDPRALDGIWRYGAEGEWHENWDLEAIVGPVPQELVERLQDASAFCPRP